MPRRRQVQTVESCTPSSAAISTFLPSLSKASLVVMMSIIVGNLPTCQGLAQLRLTGSPVHVPIDDMATEAKAIGSRLYRTRLALGYKHPIDFARHLGVDKGDYSKFEAGKKPLTLRVARIIKKRFGVSLDWIMDGDIHTLRRDLAEQIINLREVA